MNWQHFKTLLWLRRRLFRNAMSAAGKINAIMTNILVVLGVLSSISLFALSLGLGIWLLPKASPDHILFLWTGIIVAFLFFWVIGVATELQRSEVLSIEKLLHYPISLSSAFLVNYLSSLVSAATIIFLPAMIGLCVASAISLGPSMLVTLLLLAGFVLMVTSITYQFRGWLATLMVNKRRRRTIVAFVTGGILILSQLPNLINLTFVRSRQKAAEAQSAEHNRKFQALKSDIDHHKIGAKEARTRLDALIQDTNGRKQADAQLLKEAKEWTARADLALPPGWLAYGAMEAAGGHIWPGLGGAVLMSTIAGLSLRRSYRTTLRFYTGGFQASSPPRQTADAPEHTSPSLETLAVPAVTAPATRRPVSNWVARSLPWMPDEVAATALATLRSLSRAPEVKMMMLSPFFLIVAFGSSRMLGKGTPIPPSLRAAMGLGIIVTVVVSLSQLTLNQFGYDRSAFRIFVLSPMSRRNILLGKNLAMTPIILVICSVFLVIFEVLFPLSPTQLLATLFGMGSAFLVACIAGNQVSIVLPAAVRSGSMRSSEAKVTVALARIAATFGMMLAFVPLFIPVTVDYLVELGWAKGIPTYLILAALLFFALLIAYRSVLNYQGALLQQRELRILQIVTTKTD